MSRDSVSLWTFLSGITQNGYYISIPSYSSFDMFFGIKELLLHPDAFFARVSQEKINLIPPLAIVGAGVVINILMILLFFIAPSHSGYSVDFLMYGGLQRDVLMIFIIRSIFVPFGLWGFVSIAAYGIAHLFTGRGSFYATIQNVGYGMLPWTLSMVVPVVLFAYKFSTNTSYGPYSGMWLTDPYTCCIIGWVVLLWIGYLWIFAIRHTHQVSLKKAIGVIIISVAVSQVAYMALSHLFNGIRIGLVHFF